MRLMIFRCEFTTKNRRKPDAAAVTQSTDSVREKVEAICADEMMLLPFYGISIPDGFSR
jgi:hypothetical protein